MEWLQTARPLELIEAALDVLARVPAPAARPHLQRTYQRLDADGVRRDPLGTNRAAILRALRLVPHREDAGLLERAVTTYEFSLYDRAELAAILRATALVSLDDLDGTLAGFHAARLLVDPHTEQMSGEPAVTAVGVLAAAGQALPLYTLVADGATHPPEVVGECLRHLTRVPASLLPGIVEKHRDAEADVVLAGLFDLILGHQTRVHHLDVLAEFLRETDNLSLYQYLASAMVARWGDDLADTLAAVIASERSREKRQALHDALAVRAGTPAIDRLLGAMGPGRQRRG